MINRLLIGLTGLSGFGGLSACAQAQEQAQEQEPILNIPMAQSPMSQTWVNERGSAVTFLDTDGLLSGYYQTQLGAPEASTRFPLTGFIEGDQMTFTVNFKGYDSLTSWTGQMSEDDVGPYIRTLWNLTRDVPDAKEDDDLWQSITSGAATFRPAPILDDDAAD